MDAANLALDVADQRAKLGLAPVNQPVAATAYTGPMVTTSQPVAPARSVAMPSNQISIDGPPTGGFGPAMTVADADRIKRSLQMRTLGGGLLGGLVGGALLGPVGALAGGYFGRQVGAKSYCPPAPKPAQGGGESKGYSYKDLSSEGRDAAGKSKQFDKAVKSGKGGLW